MSKNIEDLYLYFYQICVQRCLERGKQSGRSDDNEETLSKRIKTYNESTIPIIEHFDKLNMVKRIDASKSESEVLFY